ncbi:hypothetical protein [Micromonospora sp. DT47]|uniref:hypothetical protein n=1 Tax=Micromonospora sp. DT47 TaxID=3393431 RepID=UPI003CF1480F
MRRLGIRTIFTCALVLILTTACGSDPVPDPDPTVSPTPYPVYSHNDADLSPTPNSPPVEPPGSSIPQQLVGFWYTENFLAAGMKGTRSYTFYASAEYLFEQSLCVQNSCEITQRESGLASVEQDVLAFHPIGGDVRQTRFSVQREYATDAIQLWLHDALGPGAADIYYLRS